MAEKYYLNSLEIWQKLLGFNHKIVATIYFNLAGLYKS